MDKQHDPLSSKSIFPVEGEKQRFFLSTGNTNRRAVATLNQRLAKKLANEKL